MNGLSLLAWRQARHARGRTLLLVTAVAVALFVPLASGTLTARFDQALRAVPPARPGGGAAESRFDLTLEALSSAARSGGITNAFADELRADGRALWCPAPRAHHPAAPRGDQRRYEQRGLVAAQKALPQFVGDLALGACSGLGLGVGDRVFSDPRLYDLAQPRPWGCSWWASAPHRDPRRRRDLRRPPHGLGPGRLLHGHAAAEELAAEDPDLVIGEAEGRIALSGALIEERRFEPGRPSDFHYHGDADRLPLTALLLFPEDEEARTILKARINGRRTEQALRPERVVDDLLAVVFRVKALLDRIALLLGLSTAALVAPSPALAPRPGPRARTSIASAPEGLRRPPGSRARPRAGPAQGWRPGPPRARPRPRPRHPALTAPRRCRPSSDRWLPLAGASCGGDAPGPAMRTREVVTASWPVTSAERLAPADVPVAPPAAEDPITWQPPRGPWPAPRARPDRLNEPAWGWVEHVSLPRSRTVDVNAPIASRLIEQEGSAQPRPAGDHTHASVDTHLPRPDAPRPHGRRPAGRLEAFPETPRHRGGPGSLADLEASAAS